MHSEAFVQVLGIPGVESAIIALNDVDVVWHHAELGAMTFFTFSLNSGDLYWCRTVIRKDLLNINISYTLDD
jgi:hypothetical protein